MKTKKKPQKPKKKAAPKRKPKAAKKAPKPKAKAKPKKPVRLAEMTPPTSFGQTGLESTNPPIDLRTFDSPGSPANEEPPKGTTIGKTDAQEAERSDPLGIGHLPSEGPNGDDAPPPENLADDAADDAVDEILEDEDDAVGDVIDETCEVADDQPVPDEALEDIAREELAEEASDAQD